MSRAAFSARRDRGGFRMPDSAYVCSSARPDPPQVHRCHNGHDGCGNPHEDKHGVGRSLLGQAMVHEGRAQNNDQDCANEGYHKCATAPPASKKTDSNDESDKRCEERHGRSGDIEVALNQEEQKLSGDENS